MKKNSDTSRKPLAELFDGYQPKPGERFYRRMETAPWVKPARLPGARSLRWPAIAGGMLLVLLLASLGVPAVRAEVLAWLGLGRAPGSQVEITPVPALISPTEAATLNANPTQTPQASATAEASPSPATPTPAPWQTYTTQQQADFAAISKQAGWTLLAPAWLPEGYQYQSVYYAPNNRLVFLTFSATRELPGSGGLTETKSLTLTQAMRNDVVPLEVAPQTEVENISVGSQAGAYALGAWDSQFDQASGQMVASWRADLPVQNVFWQAGPVYLALISDDAALSKADLIRTAASVP